MLIWLLLFLLVLLALFIYLFCCIHYFPTDFICSKSIFFFVLLYFFTRRFRKKNVWYEILICFVAPVLQFHRSVKLMKKMTAISVPVHAREKWIFGLVHNSHDSFVDRELSICIIKWSEALNRGKTETVMISTEAIVVRPRRGRRTKKK